MRAALLTTFGLVGAFMMACSEGERSLIGEEVATATEVASSATVFDLAPADFAALERQAVSGDGEASFRLSQFFGMAGGWDGRSDADLVGGDDAIQELRWLELATSQGHETAKFTLAVRLLQRGQDCARGRALLKAISTESLDADTRQGASDWLREDVSLECRVPSSAQ